jgi:outer membrane protein assembly factor BamB
MNLLAATAIVAAAPAAPAMAQNAVALTALAPRSVTGVKFHLLADGPVRGGFALAGDRLLFGTETGSLYAVARNSGHQLWRRSAGSPVLSTPAVIGARAYFTSWDNALHAVDIATGRELWRRDLGRTLGPNDYWEYYVSSPVVAGGRLYVGSGSGRVFSIDPPTGRTMWATDLGARVRTTPLVTADKVIVGTMSGHVVALSRADGRQLWKFATVGAGQNFAFKHNDTRSVVTQPIVAGGIVIAGGRDGNIYGIDLRTGEGRWRETHDGGSWILGLASDGSRFYSGSGSAFIMQGADPATGKELWRRPTGNAMFGGLALAGGVLVSNGSNGNLFAYDAASGEELWRARLGDMSLSSPLVADGVVFTGADDGSVYALETRPASAPKLDRYVYSFTDEPPASAFWFKPELLTGIRGGFLTSGYARLGSEELATALASPISDKGRRIIVLADTRLPESVSAAQLRAFLDGGGVLVMVGPDPLIYSFDAQGTPDAIDEDKATAAFGLSATDKQRDYGYNVSIFTAAAKPLGLTGRFVAVGSNRPAEVSTVLATDRSGMATAWVKRFGNGGQLISLPLPRNRSIDLSGYVEAIDLAVIRNRPAQP